MWPETHTTQVPYQFRLHTYSTIIIIALILLSTPRAWSGGTTDLSYLYDPAKLKSWGNRIEADLRWNFESPLLGNLTTRERATLGAVELLMPLYGPGSLRGHPMAFAAAEGVVLMPVMSLRFLTDIAIASAYLAENGYSLETVSDYALVLKYQVFMGHGKRIPPPLEALGIPGDALEQHWVKDTAQKIQKSALVWIMAHELGHLYYRHPGYGPGVLRIQAQRNEIEADRFANQLMQRIGIPPMGMSNFFMVLAHMSVDRGDFATDEKWADFQYSEATHPVTAERLRIIASDILADPSSFAWKEPDPSSVVPVLTNSAQQLMDIAGILANPEIQQFITRRAKSLTLDSLHPRRNVRDLQAPSSDSS